jgi:trans-resveratrol di-O-methyltransferase
MSMDLVHSQGVTELFEVQSHLYKQIFSYIDSMSVNCAIQLGIPDIIHNHGRPVTLPQLVSKLHIHPKKASYVQRLMRLLVQSGFFAKTKVHQNQEDEAAADLLLASSSKIMSPACHLLL